MLVYNILYMQEKRRIRVNLREIGINDVIRPFSSLSDADRVKLREEMEKGQDRYGLLSSVWRFLRRGSNSGKANRYEGSLLEYKMRRLDPPE